MTATTYWVEGNPTILTHEFVGEWSTAEFESEVLGAAPQIERHGENIAVIINLLQYTMPPREINILAMLRRFNQNRPDNIHLIVIVIRDEFAYSLLKVGLRVIPKTHILHLAKSMDEASALIAKHSEAS